MRDMRISEAAAATGVPATTLRFWEQAGLISSTRTAGGYRTYDERAIERLRFIGAAKRMDLSLNVIRELLVSWEGDTCWSVKQRLRPMVTDRLAQAQECLQDVSHLASTLRNGLARLDALPDRDTPCDPNCSLLDDAGNGPLGGEEPTKVDTMGAEPAGSLAPVARALSGAEHTQQVGRWQDLVAGATISRTGLAAHVDLDAGQAVAATTLVLDEQRCCPFLAFALDCCGRRVMLTITAPSSEALPFIDALLEPQENSEREGRRCVLP